MSATGAGGTGLLEATGVRKSFGDRLVLDDLDLSVDRGQCVVLIGGSGSGKSTLLRCLNRLEVIDDGRILLDGQDISDPRVDVDRVRAKVGIVFQAFNLFPHLTVLENVVLGPVRGHGASGAEAEARARELLGRFGLAGLEARRPDALSGGQQQRVAIARALATRPRALLLDEVTSALDPELVGEVLAVVRELKAEGVTMLIATHEMAFARDVADQVCFLHEGAILERGTPAEVLGAPRAPQTQRFLRRLTAS